MLILPAGFELRRSRTCSISSFPVGSKKLEPVKTQGLGEADERLVRNHCRAQLSPHELETNSFMRKSVDSNHFASRTHAPESNEAGQLAMRAPAFNCLYASVVWSRNSASQTKTRLRVRAPPLPPSSSSVVPRKRVFMPVTVYAPWKQTFTAKDLHGSVGRVSAWPLAPATTEGRGLPSPRKFLCDGGDALQRSRCLSEW